MAYNENTPSIAKKLGFDPHKDLILKRSLEEKLRPLCETKPISKNILNLAICTLQHKLSGTPPLVSDKSHNENIDERLEKIVNAMDQSIECARAAGALVDYPKVLSAIDELQQQTYNMII
ncbi:hypothetical protein FACS1894163_02480 [Spirochaetia bacterium]|nr:hypothetical protein FACS1894163_02480 [Spirochaetia bacterium]